MTISQILQIVSSSEVAWLYLQHWNTFLISTLKSGFPSSKQYVVTHNTPFHQCSTKLTFLALHQSLFWQSLPMFGSFAPILLASSPICCPSLDLWKKSFIYICSPLCFLHIHRLSDVHWIFTNILNNSLSLFFSTAVKIMLHQTTKDGKC